LEKIIQYNAYLTNRNLENEAEKGVQMLSKDADAMTFWD
jgi:hypothetical protein